MKNKKILILAKFYKGEINPFDASALECALQSGCQDITLLTMAPLSALVPLKALTRLGVKAILVSDKAYAGADTLATSKVLAKAVERVHADVVFCGRQSIDGDTAQVPIQLAKRLGYDFFPCVIKMQENEVWNRAGMRSTVKEGCIYTFERVQPLRFPSIFSKVKDVEILDNSLLQIPENECGQKGSPTRVIKAYESNVGRRFCKFASFEELDALIQEGLQSKREEEESNQEKCDVVHFIGDCEKQAKSIGRTVKRLHIEGKSAETLVQEAKADKAKIILFSDSLECKVLASQMAVLCGAGLCADCTGLRIENGSLIMTRPALGGNVTADIVCDSELTFATVRTRNKVGAKIVFGVGRGALNALPLIQELAKKYDADIGCSRTVVDMNEMPYASQIGLTGKTIAPKVYVAFGISGAVQHTCAVEGATRIIAINEDKTARIFDYADYGIIKKL